MDDATAFARNQSPECADELLRHFWPGIEHLTGVRWAEPEPAAQGPEPGEPAGSQPQDTPAADTEDHSYRFEALDSASFFAADFRLQWLVKRLLVQSQPGVIGGPKKALKTTVAVDLAVALASGTPFLGYFDVYQRRRVIILSGDSGEAVLQETGRRICAARGVDPAMLPIWWSFRLPCMASMLDRDQLAAGLKELKAEVGIIDPLYLCLLAGVDAKGLKASNLFDMGPLL